MITITERAGEALRAAVARTDGQAAGVRIAGESQGCSGAHYSLGLVSMGLEEDLQITTASGVTVFVSEQVFPTLAGAVLDYGETENGLAFSIFNPNDLFGSASAPSHGCSCGTSSCSSS